jgi:hypothetical protein
VLLAWRCLPGAASPNALCSSQSTSRHTHPALPCPALPCPALPPLQMFDLFTDRLWIWAAVGYLLATYLVLTGLTVLVLHHAQPPRIAPQVGPCWRVQRLALLACAALGPAGVCSAWSCWRVQRLALLVCLPRCLRSI